MRLPYRTSNANASNVVDLQAAYETEMATWGAVLGGANLIYHAAGWLEGGLTASYEKLVLDVEILQNMMEFLRPLPFQEDDLGFEAIKSVPAGGHFFGAEHTMSRYTTAFYQPMLSNWQNHGEIDHATPILDVSAKNDWSKVRVWDMKSNGFGTHVYAVSGFIGKDLVKRASID